MAIETTRIMLSGSTHGAPIKVAATSTPGTTIHTAQSSTDTNAGDAIFLWVTNTSTSTVNLTLEWGGTTDPDHLVVKARPVPGSSWMITLARGPALRNSLVVKAFASSANVLLITGFVLRDTVT